MRLHACVRVALSYDYFDVYTKKNEKKKIKRKDNHIYIYIRKENIR